MLRFWADVFRHMRSHTRLACGLGWRGGGGRRLGGGSDEHDLGGLLATFRESYSWGSGFIEMYVDGTDGLP